MEEDWYRGVLAEFGLTHDDVRAAEAKQVEVRLGGLHGCLWRTPMGQEEDDLLVAWEEALVPLGILAPRLMAAGGRTRLRVDERTNAFLTVWQGPDLPRLETAEELARVAGFLARFRRLSASLTLPIPHPPGLGWVESWAARAKRLKIFVQLAAERLNPTRFDLVYLEQTKYFQHQADRAVTELTAAIAGLQPCAAWNEIDRHRLYEGHDGLALKTLLGLNAEHPIRDLYRLLARTMPRLEWAFEPAAAALAAYRTSWPADPQDQNLLQAALRFPNDHYRLAYHYYLNHKAWPLRTFLRKQEEIWRAEPIRQRFVEELPVLLP